MSTLDLINKIKKTSANMSSSEKRNRLIKARIIKDTGEYDPRYFTEATVRASKRATNSLRP